MARLNIHAGENIDGDPTPVSTLHVGPHTFTIGADNAATIAAEGAQLFDFLRGAIPGGTFDAMIGAYLTLTGKVIADAPSSAQGRV